MCVHIPSRTACHEVPTTEYAAPRTRAGWAALPVGLPAGATSSPGCRTGRGPQPQTPGWRVLTCPPASRDLSPVGTGRAVAPDTPRVDRTQGPMKGRLNEGPSPKGRQVGGTNRPVDVQRYWPLRTLAGRVSDPDVVECGMCSVKPHELRERHAKGYRDYPSRRSLRTAFHSTNDPGLGIVR